jgi:hypothetical protein
MRALACNRVVCDAEPACTSLDHERAQCVRCAATSSVSDMNFCRGRIDYCPRAFLAVLPRVSRPGRRETRAT